MFSDMASINSCELKYKTAHSSKLVGAFVKAILYHCVIGAADDAAGSMRMLTRAMNVLHANTTLVDRVDLATPAIAFLSTGYRPLGSCSRAAGWSAAALCVDPKATADN